MPPRTSSGIWLPAPTPTGTTHLTGSPSWPPSSPSWSFLTSSSSSSRHLPSCLVLRAFLDKAAGHTRLRAVVRLRGACAAGASSTAVRPVRPLPSAAPISPGRGGPDARSPARRGSGARVRAARRCAPLPVLVGSGHDVRSNLLRLCCRPGAALLTEGQLVLATETERGEYPSAALHAIASGRSKHGEIRDALRDEPVRTLDRLVALRLVERVVPVTDTGRSRRTHYRVADDFLAFWPQVLSRSARRSSGVSGRRSCRSWSRVCRTSSAHAGRRCSGCTCACGERGRSWRGNRRDRPLVVGRLPGGDRRRRARGSVTAASTGRGGDVGIAAGCGSCGSHLVREGCGAPRGEPGAHAARAVRPRGGRRRAIRPARRHRRRHPAAAVTGPTARGAAAARSHRKTAHLATGDRNTK